MLCSQIRLTERRQSVRRGSSSALQGNRPSTGIVPRLCAIQNISNASLKDEDTQLNSEDSQTSRTRSARGEKPKLNLRISSLRMQPGTKTLAPTDIRRDPRKPPSFCEHFKHIKRMRSISDTPSNDLMIRGIEITQEPVQPTVECPSEVTTTENLNLNIELTECCHCLDDKHLSDRLNIEQILQDECKVKIFEKPLENGKPKHLEVVRRSEVKEPSPRTVQVISVKLNTRKLEEESEVSDEIRA